MFNKTKYKLLLLDWGSPRYPYSLGEEFIVSSPAEKELRVLVNEKLDMSHWCALAAPKADRILSHVGTGEISFIQRKVKHWHRLPGGAVDAPSGDVQGQVG